MNQKMFNRLSSQKLRILSRKCPLIFATVGALLLSDSSAIASVDLQARGAHPFPPAIIGMTSMVIALDAANQDTERGDFISGAADGVDQAKYLDCWFESAVGAIARTPRGQSSIARMITRVAPSTYRVRFPDDPQQPVEVTQAKINRLGLKDQALWSDVLEAAMMKRYPGATLGLNQPGQRRFYTDLRAKYGVQTNAEVGLKIMTGNPTSSVRVGEISDAALDRIIRENLRLQLPMEVCSKQVQAMPNPRRVVVVPNHCFAVLRYNAWTQTVTVRNPWGQNKAPKYPFLPLAGETVENIHDIGGGVLTMPLHQLKRQYAVLAWGQVTR